MADRNTTGTPYKLSADGICYFRYPDGDAPVVKVADYAELRTKGLADAGYLNQLFVSGAYVAGNFEWQADDPYSNGDDGGLVIAATDGWWVRLTVDIVRLDWFEEVLQDADITALLSRLATAGVMPLRPNATLNIVSPTKCSQCKLTSTITLDHELSKLTAIAPFTYLIADDSWPEPLPPFFALMWR